MTAIGPKLTSVAVAAMSAFSETPLALTVLMALTGAALLSVTFVRAFVNLFKVAAKNGQWSAAQ